MTQISIIGTGNMAQAISALAKRGGHDVQLLGRGDDTVEAVGDIVVLAVPYAAIDAVLAQHGAGFAGKIVVDITNPVNFETFDSLFVPADSSAAAQIAAAMPDARILKAFNTTFASTLISGQVGGLATTVLIAGDDEEAKSVLAEVVTSADLRAVDAGSLKRARELEALGFLQLTLAATGKTGWTGGFGLVA